ncbi:MAG: hypothetical protein ACRECH_11845, partial [Nitrososphaerales archaeon]
MRISKEMVRNLISLNRKGVVNDGHHTLHALMEAGMIPRFCINNKDDEENDIFDSARLARINISNRRDVTNLSRVKVALHYFLPEQKKLAEERKQSGRK